MCRDVPADIATALWYTGLDIFTKKPVTVARGMRDRKMQRALMQFFKPENWFTVREALIEAKRPDLIGDGCDCLIPASAHYEPSHTVDAYHAPAANRGWKVAVR
jgi:hypothetical protein